MKKLPHRHEPPGRPPHQTSSKNCAYQRRIQLAFPVHSGDMRADLLLRKLPDTRSKHLFFLGKNRKRKRPAPRFDDIVSHGNLPAQNSDERWMPAEPAHTSWAATFISPASDTSRITCRAMRPAPNHKSSARSPSQGSGTQISFISRLARRINKYGGTQTGPRRPRPAVCLQIVAGKSLVVAPLDGLKPGGMPESDACTV